MSTKEVCRALSDSISSLACEQQLDGSADSGLAVFTRPVCSTASANVQKFILDVLQRLEAVGQQPAVPRPEADQAELQTTSREILSQLVAGDVPARLVEHLGGLDFEVRKDAMRLVNAVLRLGVQLGIDGQVVEYVRSRPTICQMLLEGAGRVEVVSHCSEMLRSCTLYPQIVRKLLEERAAGKLIDLAKHQNFDISSEAFSSLREVLLAQRAVSVTYLQANFQEFFEQYHTLLQADSYTTQRQALRLLGDILLDRSFMEIMVTYVGNEQFLQIHMNLLRGSSKAIQLDAFHVFKVFVANPNKPHRVRLILYRNREKIVKLLNSAFSSKMEGAGPLEADLKTVTSVLTVLEPPPTTTGAVKQTSTSSQSQEANSAANANPQCALPDSVP